jgi:hypothetical protein
MAAALLLLLSHTKCPNRQGLCWQLLLLLLPVAR